MRNSFTFTNQNLNAIAAKKCSNFTVDMSYSPSYTDCRLLGCVMMACHATRNGLFIGRLFNFLFSVLPAPPSPLRGVDTVDVTKDVLPIFPFCFFSQIFGFFLLAERRSVDGIDRLLKKKKEIVHWSDNQRSAMVSIRFPLLFVFLTWLTQLEKK